MGLKSLVHSIVSHVTYLNLRCLLKSSLSWSHLHTLLFQRHIIMSTNTPPPLATSSPPPIPANMILPPPPVGVAQLRPHSYDEPAPATEQDVVMDRRVLSTWLSSTSSRLAPESAGSTKVPTCLVTLSSLYGTSTTSQCTSIC